MTICIVAEEKSSARRTGTRSSENAPGASFFRSAASLREGSGGSLMMKMKTIQFSISAADATKNEARIPKASASTPPKSGPMTPPAVIALCMTPRQTPSLSGGAYSVMMARSIGQSPAAKP